MTRQEIDPEAGLRLSAPELEVARAILVHGPVSRADLAQRLGLSPASLTRLGKPLLDARVALEHDLVFDGSVGRPTRLLEIRADAEFFIGIKITGTQVQGVLTDLRATALDSAVLELASHEPAAVIETVAELIEVLRGRENGDTHPKVISAVGLSIGGTVTGHSLVGRAPFLGWRQVDLGSLLAELTGLPVSVENDVTALVAAELWFGSGRETPNFAVLTTGAGVGYGIAVHGQVISTPDSGLGLGGHFPLDPQGPPCEAGHRGCSTAMLGMPSICAQVSTVLGRELDYGQVLDLGRAGQPAATAALLAAAAALGRFIAAIANLAMVNTVVLGGEGIELYSLFKDRVHEAIAADRDPEAGQITVNIIDPGFDQWARGAAAVAIQGYAFSRSTAL